MATRGWAAALVLVLAGPALGDSHSAMTTLILDLNTVTGLTSLPARAVVRSEARTLEALYAKVNIAIVRRDARFRDFAPGRTYTDDELQAAARTIPAIGPGPGASEWYVRGFVVPKLANSKGRTVTGLMFDLKTRQAFALAEGSIPARFLRTAAHELGHALNMFHSDGDADPGCCAGDPQAAQGASIMNDDQCLSADWDFVFSAQERAHLTTHDPRFVRPGLGPYGVCETVHVERCPS